MKSRWTTYILLTAVIAVWGIVAWKIFVPASDVATTVLPRPPAPAPAEAVAETLRLDYPDPFLKDAPRHIAGPRSAVRPLSPKKAAPPRRERVQLTHLGTFASNGRRLHILAIGEEQYELSPSDSAGGFLFLSNDRDSLYLSKNGVTYGVKRCCP